MQRISLTQARKCTPTVVDRVVEHQEELLITRRQEPVAAVVPIASTEELHALQQFRQVRLAEARLATLPDDEDGIPLADLCARYHFTPRKG